MKSRKPKLEQHKNIIANLLNMVSGEPTYNILYDLYSEVNYLASDYPKEIKLIRQTSSYIKLWCEYLRVYEDDEFNDLYWRCVLFEARNMVLDSYLLYVEKNRPYDERFYEPRRKCFLKIGLIEALQDMIDDKLDVLSISLPPGTGKTTLEKFFHSAIIGWFPREYNLFFSHSADITRMYYDGVLSILTDDTTYTWHEIFPNLEVTFQNAKMGTINVGAYKPFQNLMVASVGSEMAGKVRASKFLLVDDMIGKIEEALNSNMLEKLWNIYSTDARQRKITGCKELHLATRWSVV